MTTIIAVDKNYNVIKREVKNEKELPNKILDLIAPILKKEN